MAAGDMVQKGTTVLVGFNSMTLSGVVMETVSPEITADIKEIRGENNAVMTKLLSNPKKTITFECVVTTLSTFNTVKTGDAITINTVAYMVESAKPTYSREETKWSVTAVKEDSMTYT